MAVAFMVRRFDPSQHLDELLLASNGTKSFVKQHDCFDFYSAANHEILLMPPCLHGYSLNFAVKAVDQLDTSQRCENLNSGAFSGSYNFGKSAGVFYIQVDLNTFKPKLTIPSIPKIILNTRLFLAVSRFVQGRHGGTHYSRHGQKHRSSSIAAPVSSIPSTASQLVLSSPIAVATTLSAIVAPSSSQEMPSDANPTSTTNNPSPTTSSVAQLGDH